jgi:hypothetical protein
MSKRCCASMRVTILGAAVLSGLYGIPADAAPIHDLVVLQVGDGSDAGGTLGTGTAAVVLRDYDVTFGPGNVPSVTLMQQIAVQNTASATGSRALTLQDTASAEGGLNLSANGQYFVFAGYNSNVDGTASGGTTERVVGRLDLAGNVDTSSTVIPATVADWGSTTGSAPRNVASVDGSQYWIATSANGIRTIAHGASTTSQVATVNARRVDIFDEVAGSNQLYTSAQTTTIPMQGVATVGTGTPTASGQTVTPLPGTPVGANTLGSPYDFWFADAVTMYVADDRTIAGGGGIQKWIFDTGPDQKWELQYTINNAVYRGLTGVVIGSDVVLFATVAHVTAGANNLVGINDTLTNNLSTNTTLTILDTAAANRQFRGLDVLAIPEPSSLLLLGGAGLLTLGRRRR